LFARNALGSMSRCVLVRGEESHATSDYSFALEVLPLLSRDHQIAWL